MLNSSSRPLSGNQYIAREAACTFCVSLCARTRLTSDFKVLLCYDEILKLDAGTFLRYFLKHNWCKGEFPFEIAFSCSNLVAFHILALPFVLCVASMSIFVLFILITRDN